jgi:hypothetical protein
LKQAELGIPVAELIRQVGVSEHTFYRRTHKYSGSEINQVQEVSSNVLVIRRWLDTSHGVISVYVSVYVAECK